jgi:Holliday junction resolvase-like predicted endonuclease
MSSGFLIPGRTASDPSYPVRKSNCALIARDTSEDLLTANVFGILKNLDPKIWLTKFLGEAIKGRDFSNHSFENLSFEFWRKYRPPINRKYREGISEVDITISYKDGVVFIEAKYLAPVNLRTTYDNRRDQVIRYLDLAAYHYLNHPNRLKKGTAWQSLFFCLCNSLTP